MADLTPSLDADALIEAPAATLSVDKALVDGRTWLAVAAGMLGAFMAVIDIQITNSSLKDILGSLSATQEEGSWISTAYLVAEIVIIPMTALFARVFGMRAYMMGTTAAFLVFSTLCGAAWNLPSMIAFRALQGIAGGALIPMAMTLSLAKLPPSKRPVAMAIFALTVTVAPAFGPTLGGVLSEYYGWPAIFYVNWVPGVLLIAGIAYGLDRDPVHMELFVSADWIGISCMAVGLGSLTVFLEEGNAKDWFDSAFICTAAALAVAGLLGWVASSALRKEPFVNLGLFGRRNFLIATVVAAMMGMGMFGSLFLLSLFLGQIANYTPLQVGEVILWAALPQLMVMPLAAGLSKKVDNRILCGLGLGLFGMSCLMNSSMDANTGHDYLVWSQIVRALGQPFIMLTMTNFAMHGLEPSETASASSLFNMMRNLGGSTGIALLSTSLVNREHFHSARLGDAISLYAAPTQERLEQLTLFFISKGADPARASDQALLSIGSLVRREAFVMAYNDAFFVIGLVLLAGVGALVFADKVKADEDGGGGAH